MTTARPDARALLGVAAVAVIWVAAWGAMQVFASTPSATGRSVVAVAAAFDASVTATLALYLIAVRSKRLPRWTLALTATAGLAFARGVLGASPDVGRIVMAAASTIELAMATLVIWRGRTAIRAWRAARGEGAEVIDALTIALGVTGFPRRLASVVATELTVFAAVVRGWRTPVQSPSRFTVHRLNGWVLYAGVIGFLSLVETVVVHIALAAYVSNTLAWVLTCGSIYTVLWILGDVHALRHGGIVLEDRGLALRIGIRSRGLVPWASVESIERGAAPDGALDLSILGANVVVSLREPVTVTGLFGRQRTGRVLALSIDEPDALLAACARHRE